MCVLPFWCSCCDHEFVVLCLLETKMEEIDSTRNNQYKQPFHFVLLEARTEARASICTINTSKIISYVDSLSCTLFVMWLNKKMVCVFYSIFFYLCDCVIIYTVELYLFFSTCPKIFLRFECILKELFFSYPMNSLLTCFIKVQCLLHSKSQHAFLNS